MVKGYKVFNPDWTCQGFQFSVGKTYEITGKLEICRNGFHFCKSASDCFNYYTFNSENKVAEVAAHGDIIENGDKCCTSKLEIIREIPWQELLKIVNTGTDNTGYSNSGDSNSGNWNSGNWNSGNWNSGDWNSGNWNSGDWNSGYSNSGDWNDTKYSSGVFCTEMPKVLIFDSPSDWTLGDWRKSDARYLLNQIQTIFWIDSDKMTDQEKELHPEHETTGGFLKTVHLVEAASEWWNGLSEDNRQIIRNIPNWDSDKFYQITGIKA